MSAIREQIARRIVELREKQGLSQAEFARMADQSRSTVHGWETGRAKPDDDGMKAVAKVLGTSISYLYGETEDPRPPKEWHLSGPDQSELLQQMSAQLAQMQALVDTMLARSPAPAETKKHAILEDAYGNSYAEMIEGATGPAVAARTIRGGKK